MIRLFHRHSAARPFQLIRPEVFMDQYYRARMAWIEKLQGIQDLNRLFLVVRERFIHTNDSPVYCLTIGELPEDILVEAALADTTLRQRLIRVLAVGFFKEGLPEPAEWNEGHSLVARAALSLTGKLNATELVPELQVWYWHLEHWLVREDWPLLAKRPPYTKTLDALRILYAFQKVGDRTSVDFWRLRWSSDVLRQRLYGWRELPDGQKNKLAMRETTPKPLTLSKIRLCAFRAIAQAQPAALIGVLADLAEWKMSDRYHLLKQLHLNLETRPALDEALALAADQSHAWAFDLENLRSTFKL